MFITFEGVEGCGKTTQLRKLVKKLEDLNIEVCVTREPGGTEFGEAVRNILLNPKFKGMQPISELYLLTAARCQHVEEVIKPALKAGKYVVCDRYYDSTLAYQVGGRSLREDIVSKVNNWATSGLEPELTILIDCPVDIGLERVNRRAKADRMEIETLEFHKRIRNEYLSIASKDKHRFVVVDGTKSEEDVWNDLQGKLIERVSCLKI